jgi:hypothetical protein
MRQRAGPCPCLPLLLRLLPLQLRHLEPLGARKELLPAQQAHLQQGV